ncbi:MdlB ABC-type multidrug transport system, ATPase and permease components [Burkholderiaceae bacterium]
MVTVSLFSALFETASVASILPFMAIVMDPGIITRYVWIEQLINALGIHSQQHAVIAAGGLTICVLALGNAVSAANLWAQTRYIAKARQALSSELFAGFMRLPYSFHLERDTASLSRVLGSDVESALGGFLASLLGVVAKGLSGFVLISFIVIVDPLVALGTVVVLGGGYMFVYRLIRVRQSRLGAKMMESSVALGRATLEGFAGIKELRVLGRESTSTSSYNEVLSTLVKTQAQNLLAAALPRYVIEVIAYAGIVVVTLAFVLKGEGTAAVPSLALYALAGNRLVPIFQQFFAAAITIKYHTKAVESLVLDLRIVRLNVEQPRQTDEGASLSFNQFLQLTDVVFQYPTAHTPSLKGISLTILKNQSIGFVGKTGSGKTTLADVILGLYQPQAGKIAVDGVVLTEGNERLWRKRVGYVPQTVFLTNASIAENIALGISKKNIDHSAVTRAAQMAQAEEFIDLLPNNYQTIVGERGVKLSGGQRQRLGIARALYHQPDVLIFDEATSALDGMTEDAVMKAVQMLSRQCTMILIAHRLRTIQACDRIVMLDAGVIVADGTYEALMQNSGVFRLLAGLGQRENDITKQINRSQSIVEQPPTA